MPARQNTVPGANDMNFCTLRIGHFYFLCTNWIAQMLYSHYGTVETDTNGRG